MVISKMVISIVISVLSFPKYGKILQIRVERTNYSIYYMSKIYQTIILTDMA